MNRELFIITLIAIVALLIVAIAAYVFTHLSGMETTQVFVILAVAIAGLVLVFTAILLLARGINRKK